jgi:hypothetical protein
MSSLEAADCTDLGEIQRTIGQDYRKTVSSVLPICEAFLSKLVKGYSDHPFAHENDVCMSQSSNLCDENIRGSLAARESRAPPQILVGKPTFL